jgi:hypothetical protein
MHRLAGYRIMSTVPPKELFDSEHACRAKAAALRTAAEADASPASRSRTLEIAAEWEAKADRARQPLKRRLKSKIAFPSFFIRLFRR